MKEAKCPHCNQWSEVTFDGIGHWWKDFAGCPNCNKIVLVETECEFRTISDPIMVYGAPFPSKDSK